MRCDFQASFPRLPQHQLPTEQNRALLLWGLIVAVGKLGLACVLDGELFFSLFLVRVAQEFLNRMNWGFVLRELIIIVRKLGSGMCFR